MTTSPSYLPPAEDNFQYISNQPLDIVSLLSGSHDPKAGALVLFSGDVRDNNLDKEVAYLDYEAHTSLASKMIKEILEEAIAKWNLNLAIAQHRAGQVRVGESAVVVITVSKHRKEAYLANRHIIDRIKHEVPIWKCEVFVDGTKQWGNNCNCSAITGKPDEHIYESVATSKL
jgi:molybdopterin synthase catalytic subunit